MLGDAGGASVFFYNAFDGARGETTVVTGSVNSLTMMGIVKEKSRKGIVAAVEIFSYTISGGLGDENWAIFLTFTADDKFTTFEID